MNVIPKKKEKNMKIIPIIQNYNHKIQKQNYSLNPIKDSIDINPKQLSFTATYPHDLSKFLKFHADILKDINFKKVSEYAYESEPIPVNKIKQIVKQYSEKKEEEYRNIIKNTKPDKIKDLLLTLMKHQYEKFKFSLNPNSEGNALRMWAFRKEDSRDLIFNDITGMNYPLSLALAQEKLHNQLNLLKFKGENYVITVEHGPNNFYPTRITAKPFLPNKIKNNKSFKNLPETL